MALPEEFLYQLRLSNPIDSVMSSYVNLIRRGHGYVCLCPFHSEKSPSCTVYPDTDSFYCFGCGVGGDVITFIKKIENLDYIEAVKLLAERVGMQLPENSYNYDERTAKLKVRILEMNREAAKFFHSSLGTDRGRKALMYIAERGLAPATVKKYGIGYAPDDWDSLKRHMNSLGFSDDELVAASLCQRSQKGRVYDVFRDRVIFPIIDLRGNVIAFGGRIIDGSGPKYLNSPENAVFKKGESLFSMNFAKASKSRRLILAEGYMDVISINQAGFENVVATLGTACTSGHARLMKRYADEVIISYDSDGAGQDATNKAIKLLREAGLRTRVIKIEGAKDPDEFIKKYGAARFKLLLDRSNDSIEFELRRCATGLNLDDIADRAEYLKRGVKTLAAVDSDIDRELYISRLASEQDISPEIIKAQVEGEIEKNKRIAKTKEWSEIMQSAHISVRDDPDAAAFPKESRAERGIIAYILRTPEDAGFITERLATDDFVTEFGKRVYAAAKKRLKSGEEISLSAFSAEFDDADMGKLSEILAKSREITIGSDAVEDYIDVLLRHRDTPPPGAELSDDDLLSLQSRLRKK